MIPAPSYGYRARIVRVVDGDTFDAIVDLGFDTHRVDRFRVLGIDTPERGHRLANAATMKLTELVGGLGGVVFLRTVKAREKFGRYLASVETDTVVDVASEMIAAGLAHRYDGSVPRTPWPP